MAPPSGRSKWPAAGPKRMAEASPGRGPNRSRVLPCDRSCLRFDPRRLAPMLRRLTLWMRAGHAAETAAGPKRMAEAAQAEAPTVTGPSL